MVTIREIADLAGVSRGTVDRVLNHRGSVRKETAQKVIEIARALNYQPNPAGLTLAAQKKRFKLGIILALTENAFFAELLTYIEETAAELSCYNCSIIVKQIAFDDIKQAAAIDELLAEGIHGLAIAPVNTPMLQKKIQSVTEKGIPVVTFNSDLENTDRLAYVGSDYAKGGETIAGLMRLMTQGTVHVGIISGSPDVLCHSERIRGFTQRIEESCPRIHIVDTVYTNDDEIEGYEQTIKLLREHPEINVLFFAAGGTYGGCRALKSLKLADKLHVFCFDCLPIIEEYILNGTINAAVCQHPEVQGRKPLEILHHYLTSGETPETDLIYTGVDIRIKENLFSN